MLRRPPTQLSLTPYDLSLYDARRTQRMLQAKSDRGGRSVSAAVDSTTPPTTRAREHAERAASTAAMSTGINTRNTEGRESEAMMVPDRDLDDDIPSDQQDGAFSDVDEAGIGDEVEDNDSDNLLDIPARQTMMTQDDSPTAMLGAGQSATTALSGTLGVLFDDEPADQGEGAFVEEDDGDVVEDSILARRQNQGLHRGIGSMSSQPRARTAAVSASSRATSQRLTAPRHASSASTTSAASTAAMRTTRAQAQQSQSQPQSRHTSWIPQAQPQVAVSQATAATTTTTTTTTSSSSTTAPATASASAHGRATTRERSRRERIMGPSHADTALGSNTGASTAASSRGAAASAAGTTRRLR